MDQSEDLNQMNIANHRFLFRKKSITLDWKWDICRAFILLFFIIIILFPLFSLLVLCPDCFKDSMVEVEAWSRSDVRAFKGGNIDLSFNFIIKDFKECSWFKETGIPITGDHRHKITTSSINLYIYTSTLHISTIDKHDLGHYQCMCRGGNTQTITTYFIVRFAAAETVSSVVAIGGFLTFLLPGISHRESLDIYYTIDNKLPSEKFNIFRCSWILYPLIVWQQKTFSLTFDKIIDHSDKMLEMNICPSPDGYGTYKFFIRRQIFNKALNKSETKEFEYPTVFKVLADKSQLYDNRFFTVSTINNGPLELNESTAGHILAETRPFVVLSVVVSILFYLFLYYRAETITNDYVTDLLNRRLEKRFSKFQKKLLVFFNISSIMLRIETDIHVMFKYRSGFKRDIILMIIFILNRYFKILGYLGLGYIDLLTDFILSLSETILFFKILLFNKVMIYTYGDRVLDDNMRSGALCGIPPMDQFVKLYDVYLSYSDRDIIFVKDEILPILKERG
ncbi:uncharacterized protein LOC126828868 [Patella vulgata]|uniref:uncharacterized protein LOC126828868 n=1 Tax=Patella vulgata TaxID=6465 RepID=UPI0021803E80|nr:uncharacterized protein LOC126828868 [Patella vulgata]